MLPTWLQCGMSRAFVRESDVERLPDLPIPTVSLPPGAKNYLTPSGERRLREELQQLLDVTRPPLARAAGDDVDAKRELQVIDRRIRYLQSSLRAGEVVPPLADGGDVVRFGATVTVRDLDGAETRYRIVGVDEAGTEPNWISWISPLARTLMNGRAGDRVTLHTPRGPRPMEITAISYEAV